MAFTSLSKSASVFLILTTCFFRGMMVTFDTNVYAIARKNLFHPCTVPGGASANVIIYRSRPAPVRYVTMQEKKFKIVRCTGDNPICRWIANRWNRAASVSFVTIALNFSIRTGQRALNDHISRQIKTFFLLTRSWVVTFCAYKRPFNIFKNIIFYMNNSFLSVSLFLNDFLAVPW